MEIQRHLGVCIVQVCRVNGAEGSVCAGVQRVVDGFVEAYVCDGLGDGVAVAGEVDGDGGVDEEVGQSVGFFGDGCAGVEKC